MATNKERQIRLITWNCCRGRYDEKSAALLSLVPDLAVFQEASESRTALGNDLRQGDNPKNGVVVIATNGLQAEFGHIDEAALWSIVPLKVSGTTNFHLLAVWTRYEAGYIRSLNKALDVYGDFLRSAPAIVMGDFNSNAIWDNPRRQTDFSRVALRLEREFGLQSAYHKFFNERFGSDSRGTHHFRWNENAPFHIDYCFVPSTWRVESVEVGEYANWGSTSDHCPLVVDVVPG